MKTMRLLRTEKVKMGNAIEAMDSASNILHEVYKESGHRTIRDVSIVLTELIEKLEGLFLIE